MGRLLVRHTLDGREQAQPVGQAGRTGRAWAAGECGRGAARRAAG